MAARLRQARQAAGFVRASEAVRKFGWAYSRYMNYENGERAIPPKQAILFASAYGVSIDYIYFGKDELTKTQENSGLLSHAVRQVFLVAIDNTSDLQRIASGLEPLLPMRIPISADTAIPDNAIFIEIRDRSMTNSREEPSFEPGDKILIDLEAVPAPSEFVLALVPEEQAALFRLYREIGKDDTGAMVVDLVPLNINYRTIRLSGTNSGQIIGVCRQLHRIRVM